MFQPVHRVIRRRSTRESRVFVQCFKIPQDNRLRFWTLVYLFLVSIPLLGLYSARSFNRDDIIVTMVIRQLVKLLKLYGFFFWLNEDFNSNLTIYLR